MKYTKEHVFNNKVAIVCSTIEEKRSVLALLMEAGGTFGGKKNIENVKDGDLRNNMKMARYDTKGNDFSICHTDDDFWERTGYEMITYSTFMMDNSLTPNYQIY